MLFILHQTNCQNAFGAGFAGYLNRTFPLAKERYHMYMNACIESGSKNDALGTICEVPGEGFTVVHCFGQQFYGNSRKTGKCYTIYSKAESALAEFRRRHPNDTAICPVNMGCGLAGGDWKRYSQLLAKYNIIPCDRIDLEHRIYHKAETLKKDKELHYDAYVYEDRFTIEGMKQICCSQCPFNGQCDDRKVVKCAAWKCLPHTPGALDKSIVDLYWSVAIHMDAELGYLDPQSPPVIPQSLKPRSNSGL